MTRFTERVTRDLGQIADRATPSPTAWDSIQHRIAEQTDPSTMEVIMLSPDRNDSPKRGWMLAAAAGVIVLIGGLVFATTRSDDDTVPADTPQATLPVEPAPDAETEPAPDAEADPDPDAIVEPSPEPTGATETVPPPEPVAEPVSVTVTGSISDETDVVEGDQMVTLSGTRTYEGELVGSGPFTGEEWQLPDGSRIGFGNFDFTGSVEGLGTGTMTLAFEWRIDDAGWTSTATITGGTDDLEGASGTGISGELGTYTWDITVPPTGSLVEVTATGSGTDVDFVTEPADVDWRVGYSATTEMSGDIEGAAPHTGTAWVFDNSTLGRGEFEFTGTIAGLGTGTMTYIDYWVFANDARTYTVIVTGGTGDFEGVTGTGSFADEGDLVGYEFILTAPVER